MAKLNSNITNLSDRALGYLLEAHRLLEESILDPEYEAGSAPEFALENLKDAIGMLSPDDDDETPDRAPPNLRLVGIGR